MINPLFFERLEQLYQLSPGSLAESSSLECLLGWTSLSQVEFIAYAVEMYGSIVTGEQLGHCESVRDLARLLGQD